MKTLLFCLLAIYSCILPAETLQDSIQIPDPGDATKCGIQLTRHILHTRNPGLYSKYLIKNLRFAYYDLLSHIDSSGRVYFNLIDKQTKKRAYTGALDIFRWSGGDKCSLINCEGNGFWLTNSTTKKVEISMVSKSLCGGGEPVTPGTFEPYGSMGQLNQQSPLYYQYHQPK